MKLTFTVCAIMEYTVSLLSKATSLPKFLSCRKCPCLPWEKRSYSTSTNEHWQDTYKGN